MPIDPNFEAVGFDSQYFPVNMGTMIFFFLIYLVLLCILLPLCGLCASKVRKFKKCRKRLSRKLRWNSLITLVFESYQIIVVCVLINIQIFTMEMVGMGVLSILCAVVIFLSVAIPAVLIYTVHRDFDRL